MTFTFGKHRGKLFEDVLQEDPSYLKWCMSRKGMNTDVVDFGTRNGLQTDVVERIQSLADDRSFQRGLFVDLIPASSWGNNARAVISIGAWGAVRAFVLQRCMGVCECCNDEYAREVHERWSYDEESGVQTLRRLLGICKECHEATHYGLAEVMGKADEAKQHIMQVENLTEKQVDEQINEAFRIWRRRSSVQWKIDLSALPEHIRATPPV